MNGIVLRQCGVEGSQR